LLSYFINNQKPDEYLFLILSKEVPVDKMDKFKNDKLGSFNKHIRVHVEKAGVKKTLSRTLPATLGQTWGNTLVSP